jgi:hypothetical protein
MLIPLYYKYMVNIKKVPGFLGCQKEDTWRGIACVLILIALDEIVEGDASQDQA